MSPPTNTTTPPPDPISDHEAKHYYYGLFSNPVLVARTGKDTWEPPTGPEAYLKPKELRSVGNHVIQDIWEERIAHQIHNILDGKGVQWTSTDVIRIGLVGKSVAPICIWIGVKPNTLSRQDGLTIVQECKELLVANNIADIEVEIRESVVTRYFGTKLHNPLPSSDPTAQLLEPLTTTLGLPICNANTDYAEGTGGFYVTDCDDKSILYLVTARHILFTHQEDIDKNETFLYSRGSVKTGKLFPPIPYKSPWRQGLCFPIFNDPVEYKANGRPRINVALFGHDAYKNYVQQINQAINDQKITIKFAESRMDYAKEGGNRLGMGVGQAVREHEVGKRHVQEAKYALLAFTKLEKVVVKGWSDTKDRILGYVHFAPPIQLSVGRKKYTQDYALIRIDRSKIDHTNFTGNAIDLGTQIPPHEFKKLMFPNIQNSHNFDYPPSRLFKVQGIISDAEMASPTIIDQNGNTCLVVIKRGNTTGLTVGHASNIRSFVRNYFPNGETNTSMEWAIHSQDKKLGPFSAEGDSGSGIVDCLGRLGGLLTGGSGLTDGCDITYATPVSFILDSLKSYGFNMTIEAIDPKRPVRPALSTAGLTQVFPATAELD